MARWQRSGGAGALATVVVLETNDVVQLRRRDLHQLDLLVQRLEPVNDPGGDTAVLARPQVHGSHRRLVGADVEPEPTAQDEERLVLDAMGLEGQALARLDRDDLPHVAVGLRPDALPAPGLVDDALGSSVGAGRRAAHVPRTRLSPASTRASRAYG